MHAGVGGARRLLHHHRAAAHTHRGHLLAGGEHLFLNSDNRQCIHPHSASLIQSLRLEEEFVDEGGVEEGDLLLVVELLPGGV